VYLSGGTSPADGLVPGAAHAAR